MGPKKESERRATEAATLGASIPCELTRGSKMAWLWAGAIKSAFAVDSVAITWLTAQRIQIRRKEERVPSARSSCASIAVGFFLLAFFL
jgi:hypothetical protein